MIDHLELQTRDVEANLRFYADVLAPLGYTRKVEGRAKGFGDGTALDLFISEGEPSNVHFAFAAPTRALIDKIYETARATGHRLDRPPALLPAAHENYYSAFLRDPDGRLVEFACHKAE